MSVCIHTYIYIYCVCIYCLYTHTHTYTYTYIYIYHILYRSYCSYLHMMTYIHTYMHSVVHQFRVCITAVFVILHTYYCIPIVINWSMSRILATKKLMCINNEIQPVGTLEAAVCVWPSSTTSPMMTMHCPYVQQWKQCQQA